jgi:hypothetical protein
MVISSPVVHSPSVVCLQYTLYRKPMVFNALCKLAMLLSTAMLVLGIVLVWLLYPRTYSYQEVGAQVAGWLGL